MSLTLEEKKAIFNGALRDFEAQEFQNELLLVVNGNSPELLKKKEELNKAIIRLREHYPEFKEKEGKD